MSRLIVAMATLLVLSLGSASASAQAWRPPTDAERCPSKWGAGDERGAANLMKPEIVLRAARLIKAGEVIELAYPLFDGMPFPATRSSSIRDLAGFGGRITSATSERSRGWSSAPPSGSRARIR